MYIPAHFRVDSLDTLHRLIQENSFGTLVTVWEGTPFASHVPFLLDAERGEKGVLRGHLARANSQWKSFAEGQEALVIFQGPHAYISPAWYTTHPSVPTWNYTAVHAYGVPRLLDAPELFATLRDSVAAFENGRENPWLFESLTEEYVQQMIRGIVGFEMPITRLEGKFKLNQNRSEADRESVVAALEQSGDPMSVALAAQMRL